MLQLRSGVAALPNRFTYTSSPHDQGYEIDMEKN